MYSNNKDYFTQWDRGVSVSTSDADGTECRFANENSQVTISSFAKDGWYPIPDVLLLTGRSIIQYSVTKREGTEYVEQIAIIRVIPAARPEGYIVSETEVKTWQALKDEIERVDAKVDVQDSSLLEQLQSLRDDVEGKAPAEHEHTVSDITDFPSIPVVPEEEIAANSAARHTHDNKFYLDNLDDEWIRRIANVPEQDIYANSVARHTHQNKDYLDGLDDAYILALVGGGGTSGRDTKVIEFAVSGGAYSPCAYSGGEIAVMANSMNVVGHVTRENKWFSYAGMDSYGTYAIFSRLTANENDSGEYQYMSEYLLVSSAKSVTHLYKEISEGGGGGAVNSVNGKTGNVVIKLSELGGVSKDYVDAEDMRLDSEISNTWYEIDNLIAATGELNLNKISEPTTDGTAGQVLTTDGNGGRTWTTPQGGGDKPWKSKKVVLAEDVKVIDLDFDGDSPSEIMLNMLCRLNNESDDASTNGNFGISLYCDNGRHIDACYTSYVYRRMTNYPYTVLLLNTPITLDMEFHRMNSQSWTSNDTLIKRAFPHAYQRIQYPAQWPSETDKISYLRLQTYDIFLIKANSEFTVEWR